MKKLSSYFLFLSLAFLVSCSSDDNGPELQLVDSAKTIDPELVGTWDGEVSGTLGTANVVFMLENDGAITADTDSEVICPFIGSWWVTDGSFQAGGEDECDGTGINLLATGTSKIKISGNWTATSGNSGTFSMTKQ